MLHKCSTNCIWKGLRPVNDLQGYCRCCHLIGHIRFLLFFHCKYISIWHRVEILTLICQKIKMSRDLDHTHLGGQFVVTGLLRDDGKTPVPRSVNTGPHSCIWGPPTLAPAMGGVKNCLKSPAPALMHAERRQGQWRMTAATRNADLCDPTCSTDHCTHSLTRCFRSSRAAMHFVHLLV